MRIIACVLVSGLVASSSFGQRSAGWFAELEVADDGSSVDVTLWIEMESEEPFLAFAGSLFDTLGVAGPQYGAIVSWEVLNGLDEIGGDTTTTDGDSLFGTLVGQSQLDLTDANPLEVLTFRWEADDRYTIDEDGAAVSYATSTEFVTMWVGEDLEGAEAVKVPFEEAAFGWFVVPAPGGVGIMMVIGLSALGRRR